MTRNAAASFGRTRRQIETVLIAVALVTGLTSASFAHDTIGTIAVGSFNLNLFGHPKKPRSMESVRRLAHHIDALQVDVLGCQEIKADSDQTGNGRPDWDDLLEALGPQYSGHLGTTGGHKRTGLIWRNDRVDLSDIGELKGIEPEKVGGTESFPRIPLTAYVKSKTGGLDFRLIVVHLTWESGTVRYREGQQINRWGADYLASGSDKHVLVIGDFNTRGMGERDSDKSPTIANMEAKGRFISVSKSHHEYTTPLTRQRYDHAVLSPSLFEEEYRVGSWDVHREACEVFPTTYISAVSNHVPVSLHLLDVENDDTPPGNWAKEAAPPQVKQEEAAPPQVKQEEAAPPQVERKEAAPPPVERDELILTLEQTYRYPAPDILPLHFTAPNEIGGQLLAMVRE